MLQFEQDFGSDTWFLKDDEKLIGSVDPLGGSFVVRSAAGEVIAMRPDEKSAMKALTDYALALEAELRKP